MQIVLVIAVIVAALAGGLALSAAVLRLVVRGAFEPAVRGRSTRGDDPGGRSRGSRP